eukprot:TRINITY_DN2776_c0_g1_i1.p1 TRINITY_DN2776_c0_g1~~TRINITY_DN2776_c0_g1_i1.p1  ORF type:complete len:120 (-),score=29.87 TRINITY_DN2776_c0_g1_i1:31-390(-)
MAYHTKRKNKVLHGDEDYKTPKDKEKAKSAEEAATKKLSKDEKAELKEIKTEAKKFKDAFAGLEKFVKEQIMENFSEYEFYLPADSSLGEGMLIPARYEGEAVAPIFYLWIPGIKEKKE